MTCSSNENSNENTKNMINAAVGNAKHSPKKNSASPKPKTSFSVTFSLYF